ncbi:MAG: iron-sulfur cluster repair di-iron protein [Bacteroidetes bacterium]|nr:iron-sulfur cluster repair di-iron protein [Bacteroidota bacterium]
MENLSEKTLATIVKENSRAATVFEKYELDFCCKGKRSLLVACEEKGLNTQAVETALQNILQSTTTGKYGFPYEKLSSVDLCEYIVDTHHVYVKEELPRILGYAQKVASKHGERLPNLNKLLLLVEELYNELMPHLQKEEEILFPIIKQLETVQNSETASLTKNLASVKEPIAAMEHEHDHAGEVMAKIRAITDQYQPPQNACTTFRVLYDSLHRFEQDLHQHVHLENNVLFSRY